MAGWLLGAALGPAAVALPVNWVAAELADAAQRWFKRLRHTDSLSRLVISATGSRINLTRAEFDAVRRLLEDQHTWTKIGQGTVEELATLIAGCIPPVKGRTASASHEASVTIAYGLLEFAVADLDPPVFQRVLMARLKRMEDGQASALDKALLVLHADLVARLDAKEELDARRFGLMLDYLKDVLERLPPGRADRAELVVYLRTLATGLDIDPWPNTRRFGGPVLSPAAIERRLHVTAADRKSDRDPVERNLDADDLGRQCRRLVILGGPGSGKTWLARRTARRCAENALQALADGASLDEVELPLYTTCSRLFAVRGEIREAVISSAFEQLDDLGSPRLSSALCEFFAERTGPTLLVLDSLDEARGSDKRLYQADT